ncbi:MAG: hypothetical protein ACLP7J_27580 [Streptosporangiaceae bacterium]
MSSEVTELINALHEGSMTLEQVARRFRERPWPRRETAEPASYLELAAAAQQDPEPYIPGSFDDVVAAYDIGKITDHQYAVLSEAVAEAKRAQDRSESAGDPA